MTTRILWLALVATGFIGCAHAPPMRDGLSYPARRARLQSLEAWDMRGRIAVNTGERAFQGRFQWRQNSDILELSISSPLGAGIMQVEGPAQALTITADGKTWQLDNPEQDLSALLGWWLPVTSFRSWLMGIPDPDFAATEAFGPDGALATLEQRLWRLSFPSYQLAQGILLPRRIDLSHDRLELRVIVDRWTSAALN